MRTASFIVMLVCLLPMILALLAEWIAQAAGCRIDFSKTYPCAIWGADWGEALHTLYILAWINLATTPIAMCAAAAWLTLEVVLRTSQLFRKRRPS